MAHADNASESALLSLTDDPGEAGVDNRCRPARLADEYAAAANAASAGQGYLAVGRINAATLLQRSDRGAHEGR
jgi:hypothetical protein